MSTIDRSVRNRGFILALAAWSLACITPEFARGWSQGGDSRLPLQSAMLQRLKHSEEAMRLNQSDSAKPPDLDTFEPVLAIPVVAADVLVAEVLYGAHKSGEEVSMDEQRIIEAFIEPAGGAYATVEVAMLRRTIDELRG